MIEVEFYKGYITIKMLVTLHEPTNMSFKEITKEIIN